MKKFDVKLNQAEVNEIDAALCVARSVYMNDLLDTRKSNPHHHDTINLLQHQISLMSELMDKFGKMT